MHMLAALLTRQATPTPGGSDDGDDTGLVVQGVNLAWDQVVNLLKWVGGFSASLIWTGIVLIGFVWITGRIRRRLRRIMEARVKGRNNLPALVDNILQIGVYIIAALFIFSALGADSSAFVQAFGLITAAVSFSLQDVLKNFVAGLYLLAEEPFSTGDRLEVSGQVGTVEEVNVRTTVIRNDKAEQVLVPNYEVFSKIVTNRTAYRLQTLTVVVTGITEDLDEVMEGQEAWLADLPGLSPGTPPRIELARVGPDGCDLTVTVWVTPGKDLRREVIQRLRRRFPNATLAISA